MNMKLLRIVIKDFKGVKSASYDFDGENKTISGMNGVGKSTVADAWYWAMADCDYRMKSNPMIRMIGVLESLPEVTALMDIDGIKVTFTKRQEAKPTANSAGGKVPIANKYEVNGVPMSERDVWKKFGEMGIDKDTFLALSHPSSFTSQKAIDMRKVLFGMVNDVTDIDIASKYMELDDLNSLLNMYSVDEISAMNKATIKKAKERVASIPDIIIGMERSKSPDKLSDLEKEREQILAERKEKEAKYDTSDLEKQYAEKREAMLQISEDIKKRKYAARQDAMTKLNEETQKKLQLEQSIRMDEIRVEQLDKDAENCMNKINRCREYHAEMKRDYDAIGERTFYDFEPPVPLSDKDMICPTCGQELPKELRKQKKADYEYRLSEAKKLYDSRLKAWQDRNEAERGKLINESKVNAERIKSLNAELKGIGKKKQDLLTVIDACKKDYAGILEKFEKATKEYESMDEYHDLEEARVAQLKEELNAIHDEIAKIRAERDAVSDYEDRIRDIDRRIVLVKHNADIDKEIEAFNDELLQNEQEKAYAEKIIDQLDLLSRKKNELLTEQINSHFKVVQFALFDYLKNGEYKETCIPKIDGKAFNESLNTGMELIGKLDICEGLQKFYDKHYPVFLDNAESLNSFNVPDIDTQLITIRVTDDKKVTVS